jgi:hypothetical protein
MVPRSEPPAAHSSVSGEQAVELFYRVSDGTLMAVPVAPGSDFVPGAPIPLFQPLGTVCWPMTYSELRRRRSVTFVPHHEQCLMRTNELPLPIGRPSDTPFHKSLNLRFNVSYTRPGKPTICFLGGLGHSLPSDS